MFKYQQVTIAETNMGLVVLPCFQALSDPRFSFFKNKTKQNNFNLYSNERHLACGCKCTPCKKTFFRKPLFLTKVELLCKIE